MQEYIIGLVILAVIVGVTGHLLVSAAKLLLRSFTIEARSRSAVDMPLHLRVIAFLTGMKKTKVRFRKEVEKPVPTSTEATATAKVQEPKNASVPAAQSDTPAYEPLPRTDEEWSRFSKPAFERRAVESDFMWV